MLRSHSAVPGETSKTSSTTETAPQALTIDIASNQHQNPKPSPINPASTGPMAMLKATLQELGITFGFAALYFSVLPAIMRGQTPGKRLLRIRVVLLDGTSPNLWDAFVRYGGYTAGFATGLLGFLQIYWDANRQAIQDKISETLVIKSH